MSLSKYIGSNVMVTSDFKIDIPPLLASECSGDLTLIGYHNICSICSIRDTKYLNSEVFSHQLFAQKGSIKEVRLGSKYALVSRVFLSLFWTYILIFDRWLINRVKLQPDVSKNSVVSSAILSFFNRLC